MRFLLMLASLIALAGCAEPEAAGGDWRLAGSFEAEPRPDWGEFEAIVNRYPHDESFIMESFPEQFAIHGLNRADCASLRADLEHLAYVRSVGDCTDAG